MLNLKHERENYNQDMKDMRSIEECKNIEEIEKKIRLRLGNF